MKRRTGIVLGVVAVVTATLAIGLASVVPFSSDTARQKVIALLAEKFDADVELRSLHVRVLPTLHAEGDGLTVRHKGRTDVPPLITVAHFAADASVLSLYRKHLSHVRLEGLDIEIPPDRNKNKDEHPAGVATSGDRRASTSVRAFVIDQLQSVDGRLVIIPDEPDKEPRVWAIHRLRMQSVSFDRSMPFDATLTNAIPPGEIDANGNFGPWRDDEPGETPLDGRFVFKQADLSVFKGITGILSAAGSFGGSLERIDIHGQTETPAFTVTEAGHPISLHAAYHAVVDGTNGNTYLENVDATFNRTEIVAKGSVVHRHGIHGRTVSLDVTMEKARLEDVLLLAVDAPQPPMTGALKLHTAFVIPPGHVDVVRKLQLEGRFTIADTRFTSLDVQRKIDELSRRSSGRPADVSRTRVASNFAGTFRLAHGTLSIPSVAFDTPGSIIRLSGNYRIEPETLDFSGTLFMNAKLSETTTGFKSLLLKIADPFFKRPGGGSAIPIKITGPRSDPDIGLDKGRVFGK
ncbi:MAG TPA: AsmA-like C-terminal region-containing protein [Vicinamibacterales bacterium]|nr:AsmA-like C-terminal region-containing protein [Vicinamibacterales bacterium]